MKNLIKKSMVIAMSYYALAIIGCTKCNCRNAEGKEYKFKEISISNNSYLFNGSTSFSSRNNNSDTLNSKEYGISVTMNFDLAYNNQRANFPGLMNTALACDCTIGQNYLSDPIDSISIVTLNDLDAVHPAGAAVNEYFKVISNGSGVLEYRNLNDDKQYGIFIIGAQSIRDFYFFNPDSLSKTVAFEVNIIFKSGKIIKANTEPVFLK